MSAAAGVYFDSHCHIQDTAFDADRSDVLTRAASRGIAELVIIGVDPQSARAAKSIADTAEPTWPRARFTAGLHPHDASRWDKTVRSEIEVLLQAGAVAVGETGLDFHYDNSPREIQRQAFADQIELAVEHDLPVVVHSRDASSDTLKILSQGQIPPDRVVLHCFSEGQEMLDEGVARGYYVSFSGMITFRSFPGQELTTRVPRDRLLVESDAPYLAPVPHRGKRNEPTYLPESVARLAEYRQATESELAALTYKNAQRFYDL